MRPERPGAGAQTHARARPDEHPLVRELACFSAFHVPELKLWLLPPDAPSWRATEPLALGMAYWAFAWPGGQALARYVLDHPAVVRGRRVLDFGCGCALEGLAAARAGASSVLCADLDLHAEPAVARNAAQNGVRVDFTATELIGSALEGIDTVLVGDVCYDEALAARVVPWLRDLASRGVDVLVGDPGRVPGALHGAQLLATYQCSFDGDPRGLTRWSTAVLRLSSAVPPGDPRR